MRQELAFNPKARSYVGAMGLMQLMPSTARLVTSKYAPETAGANPFDPSANISLGQAYLAPCSTASTATSFAPPPATTADRAT